VVVSHGRPFITYWGITTTTTTTAAAATTTTMTTTHQIDRNGSSPSLSLSHSTGDVSVPYLMTYTP